MKKKLIIICVICCFLIQIMNITHVYAANKKLNVFFEDNFCYLVTAKDEVYLAAINSDYAEKMNYYQSVGESKKKQSPTLEIPSEVVHKGKKYTVTGTVDLESHAAFDRSRELEHKSFESYFLASSDLSDSIQKSDSTWSEISQLGGVEHLIIPNTIRYIGVGSFNSLYSLKSVEFRGKNYKNLVIGANSFNNYNYRIEITLPEGTKEIGAGAFFKANLYIPASVKKIGSYAVNAQTKVILDKSNKHFKLKNGILYSKDEKILYAVTKEAPSHIKISSKTTKIMDCAFANSKVRTVKFNNKIQKIPKCAFANCSKLSKISGLKKVKKIEYGAFAYCEKLKSMGKLPNLNCIKKAAFWKDEKLQWKPDKKVKIAKYAFKNPPEYE